MLNEGTNLCENLSTKINFRGVKVEDKPICRKERNGGAIAIGSLTINLKSSVFKRDNPDNLECSNFEATL